MTINDVFYICFRARWQPGCVPVAILGKWYTGSGQSNIGPVV